MRRILIIANTYYQLIISIQMRLTIFKDYEVVFLLSDQSINSDVIARRLAELNVFEQVCYIELKGLVNNRKKIDKIADFVDISFKKNNRYTYYLKELERLHFDEIICFNYHIDIIGLYSFLSKENPEIRVSLMEEGILSYPYVTHFEETIGRKIIEQTRKLQGKRTIENAGYRLYCFYPELYNGVFEAVPVPKISKDSECAKVLRSVFRISDDMLNYPQKYIFFSSVYDFSCGKPIGEFELVKQIGDLVGRENLIIKCHPRDTREIFESEGFEVDTNSSIPWEAIQLSGDFSDKIFVTATSGSVLAGSFMSENSPKTFYLYPLCDISGNSGAQGTARNIYKLLHNESMKMVLNKVQIAEKIEEILK